jgi:broad specificity phosphatase PhoE
MTNIPKRSGIVYSREFGKPMKLYFVRHGHSVANELKIISNRNLDHPLTEKGIGQVQALANSLTEHTFAAIYTSPIRRAVQSAQLLAQKLGVQPMLTDALREPDMGELEGRSDKAAWKEHQEIYQRWWLDQADEARIPDGESFNDVKTRFLPFIDGLLEKYVDAPATEILLVGHGGLYVCMLPLLLKNISTDFAQSHIPSNCGLILAENRENGCFCLSWDGLTEFSLDG